MRRLALVPLLTLGLLLFPPAASALGLGEIEMQSALNERLDAEIPLRGVAADDRERIIVTLASEEAFRQVGLRRPFSLTRLQFEVKQHSGGQFYVHVTSREPIVEPFLTFLIEVDWPDGNLLREYTVLLDPPVFVSGAEEAEAAGAEPMAEAPTDSEPAAEPAAVAEPAAEPEPVAEPEPEPEPEPEMVAEAETAPGDFSDTPVFLQVEQAEERAEAEQRRAAEAAEPEPEAVETAATTRGYAAGPQEYGPVQRGENLWNIATRLKRADMTVQQMMLALLRYNPEAFIQGNINLLKQGYVLRVPDAEAVLSLSAQQAVAQVREHNALWQEFRARTRTTATAAAPATGEDTAAASVAGEEASLKIVGAEEGTGASSDEAASATTSGSRDPSEELKLAREQLESTRMERDELQSRVDELEETVGKMERLIEVREDQLARLQEQLSKLQEAADAESVAEAGQAEPAAQEDVTAEEAAPAEEAEDEEAAAAAEPAAQEPTGEEEITVAEADTTATQPESDTAATGTAATGAAAESAGQAGASGSGVTTVRTQPAEPTWLERGMAFWNSVRDTVSGMLAGVGLGAMLANPYALPGVGVAVVLLLLALLLARRRRAGEEEALQAAGGGAAALDDEGNGEDEQFAAMLQSESDEGVALEEDTSADWESEKAGGEEAESALMNEDFDLDNLDEEDRTVTSGGSDDDTLAEADVYLAYGLHQQAEELLKLALQEQPDRTDYHAKMLETLYGAGKADEFVEHAQTFQARVGDTSDPAWLRAVAMGKELAPDNPLFQQEVDETLKPAEPAAAQPPGTDFEVGGEGEEATDLDFSFDEEADETDEEFSSTMMVDAGELEGTAGEAGTGAPEESSAEAGGEDMDFDLTDFAADETDTELPSGDFEEVDESDEDEEAADTGDFEFDLGDLDVEASPSVEQSSAGDSELADVDLGDLAGPGEGTETDAGSGQAEATDEEFDIDLGDFDDEGGAQQPEGDEESFDLGDLEVESGDEEITGAGADEGDEETVALDSGDDTSLGDLEQDLGAGPETAGVDEGGDEDEFDTMLDLARAYIDMGDSESARAALEEVAESGNDKQRSEAQSLLESV